ncbi:NAD(P)/FAD-dependent oxidoreductase [Colwellia sp. BRX8-7]|jgi:NADH dehydrogenase|uniref:NAD(P)/FAD-dependent oxidoreductase n=1 Tax=Colwellia sp. BRX8-7 TaxID=2759833 RepID=UPI0015F3A27E|nr:NAD(P)/FAD-dependent oxidoreductase [Colwellia sp. BRX8-7]MBA6337034.1 NAD(P)/FAD-dependent oxidoreductase [Colwellia sp. BRX8-7]
MLIRPWWRKPTISSDPIVIIGGGAGGLELATKLGKYFRKTKQKIILIDQNRKHVWKPLLHEVASGSLDADIDCVDYLSHGARNGFLFQLGVVDGLNRESKHVLLKQLNDQDGALIFPARQVKYSLLVFALGSVTNDFNTLGAKQYCTFLDTCENAERFHTELLNAFLRLKGDDTRSSLNIAIIGGGATGVELAAEIVKTSELLKNYGYDHLSKKSLDIHIVEAGPRILAALPERIAQSAQQELEALGITVNTNTAVTEVTPNSVITKDGREIASSITVWAAGIKGPDFMQAIGGLESAKNNQLLVNPFLQTPLDTDIFALGDCASCTTLKGIKVPPRAQAAHQMASTVFTNIIAKLALKPLVAYEYIDYGSLVSLSSYTAVGSLMGNINQRSMFIEGKLARLVYIGLYRMHQVTLFGVLNTLLIVLVGRVNRALRPNLKLH